MAASGDDVSLLSVGADLPYLTGYEAMPLERLTMLVVPRDGEATLVVPRLEAPRVQAGAFAIRPWEETEDPVAIVAGLVGGAARARIGDTTWSVFLLGLQEALPGTVFAPASELMRGLRVRKDAGEIEALRAAAAAADRAMARLDGERFSGRTEREISDRIGRLLVEEGHESVDFAIVAAGPNGASPHHEPSDRVVEEGDTVVVDFGGRLEGYRSDTTRTFQVGEAGGGVAEAFAVLEDAQAAAVAAVRPGVAAQEIDAVARQIITGAGFGEFFIHRTGHGIGMETHEHPYLVDGVKVILIQVTGKAAAFSDFSKAFFSDSTNLAH